MITGQLIIYKYNNLSNSREGVERNQFELRHLKVKTPEEFRWEIKKALDELPSAVGIGMNQPPGGYVLVKWAGRMFLCEKDKNLPKVPYVRHELKYHPLMSKFTV